MKKTLIPAVAITLLALTAGAEVRNGVDHTPPSCVLAGELPLLQVRVEGKGELRGYFRRVNTTDWCSVVGTNDGPLSRVVLPKFENGDEIEYFFVLIDGVRIMARSPRIHRVRVALECETAWARHILPLTLECGETAQAVPSAMEAGYLIGDEIVKRKPPVTSPDRPDRRP